MASLSGNHSYTELFEFSSWVSPLDIQDGIVQVVDVVSRTASSASDYIFTYDIDVYQWDWTHFDHTMRVENTQDTQLAKSCILTSNGLLILAIFIMLALRCNHHSTADGHTVEEKSSGAHHV